MRMPIQLSAFARRLLGKDRGARAQGGDGGVVGTTGAAAAGPTALLQQPLRELRLQALQNIAALLQLHRIAAGSMEPGEQATAWSEDAGLLQAVLEALGGIECPPLDIWEVIEPASSGEAGNLARQLDLAAVEITAALLIDGEAAGALEPSTSNPA